MKRTVFFSLALLASILVFSKPKPIYLWKDVKGMAKEKTRLYVYPAPDSIRTGLSVIVCPGGSYHHLGLPHEGYQVAEWLNRQGITAFVLRYRVEMFGYNHPAMIQDIQRAIQVVRENATEYKIDATKIGAMGFSAGGHLVLMAGAFHKDNYLEKIGIQSLVSLRPDFVVPVYPVVSMQDSLAHVKSRKNLLGKSYDKMMMDKFSMELQLTNDMPPVFLVTAKDDPVVKYQNSVVLNDALTKQKINHEFLLYEQGGHGFGMNVKRGGETAKWNVEFKKWLIENKFIK
ncbi:MAG: alpha/beta hydrolase [Paludibacteraceae bacterium]|nr:alpha/beta hydrolase [Paludibacteraceae bacterium]MBN2787564.1 alpha/beta hydrolase [Paludibacteraceae bacterium]